MRCVIVGAYSPSIVNFRGELIRDLVKANVDVIAMAGYADQETITGIQSLGASFRTYPIERNSMSIRADIGTILHLKRAFKEIQPDFILAYTIKPVIWGAIAAKSLKNCRFFSMLEGVGYAFQGDSFRRRALRFIVCQLYKVALKRSQRVIFLNQDNRDLFLSRNLVDGSKVSIVNGTGINTEAYSYSPMPGGAPCFLLIARLLGEKGLREFRNASLIVKSIYPEARFVLLGPPDPSPDGIPIETVLDWQREGAIEYLGEVKDVRPAIQSCHIYVLPSYHEGMPRTVLEAMSMGRPVLTTDAAGCRETVVSGENGWLVPVGDVDALAERMIWFLENRDAWHRLGLASRKIAESKFDVRAVNRQILNILGVHEKRNRSRVEEVGS